MNPIYWLYNRRRFKNMSLKDISQLSDEDKIQYIMMKIDDALKKYQKEKVRSDLVGQE